MAKNDDGSRMLRCSFCGKTQDKVDKLIAGTGAVSYTHLDVYKRQHGKSAQKENLLLHRFCKKTVRKFFRATIIRLTEKLI